MTKQNSITDRFKIVKGSVSGHCCFDYSVVDMLDPTNKDLDVKNESENYKFNAVCETFFIEQAQAVCIALNNAKNELERYEIEAWQIFRNHPHLQFKINVDNSYGPLNYYLSINIYGNEVWGTRGVNLWKRYKYAIEFLKIIYGENLYKKEELGERNNGPIMTGDEAWKILKENRRLEFNTKKK